MGNHLSSDGVDSWSATCVAVVQQQFAENCAIDNVGLLYQNGSAWLPPTKSSLSPCPVPFPDTNITAVWGINRATCDRYCSVNEFYQEFVFQDFATASANWLLPWLALFAQLPYEAAGTRDNLMSCILAVGSPALLAYSLALTGLNRWQIRTRFQRLIDSKAKRLRDYVPYLEERLEAACQLLQEAQQCPLRLSNESGWLSSLILLPQNTRFWATTTKYLKTTRRRTTPSLVAQTLLAIITYFFTFFSSVSQPGSTIVGLQFALSSGFTWLFTLIFGVLFISSQIKVFAVKDALDEPEVSDGDYRTFRAVQAGVVVSGRQKGIRSRTGLNSLVRYRDTSLRPSGDQGQDIPLSPMLGAHPMNAQQPPLLDVQSPTRPATPSTSQEAPVGPPLPAGAAMPAHPDALRPRPSARPMQDSPEHLNVPLPSNTYGPSALGLSFTSVASSASSGYRRTRTSTDRLLPAQATPADSDPFEYFTPPMVPKFGFWRIEGDERKEGPLYNYARIFTSAQTLRQLEHGCAASLTSLCAGTGRPEKSVNGQLYNTDVRPMPDWALSGNTFQMAVFTDLPPPDEPGRPYLMAAYPGWHQMEVDLVQSFAIAFSFGLAILWSALGSAIYISYNTPATGLGCRSGALLLYGLIASMSFVLLLASSALSHEVLLRYQKIFREHPEEISEAKYEPWGRHDSTAAMILFRFMTVFTRVLGKSLAFIAAIWLLTACIMELAGFFDQCWCQSNALSRGHSGLVLLFRTQSQLARVAQKVWIAGFCWSIAVPLLAAAWFAALEKKARKRD